MNKQHSQQFKASHQASKPLFLTNVWDAASAAILAKMGAPALATSSAALCWSLGYQDGNQMPFGQLTAAIERITQAVDIPLSVDIEIGYSDDPDAVADHVAALIDRGVVGINIEDGRGQVDALVTKIDMIRSRCAPDLFINARTDVYLQNLVAEHDRCQAAIDRARVYLAAGADGIFVPGLSDLPEIKQLAQAIAAPLNVMVNDRPEDWPAVVACGVARVSSGPSPFLNAYAQLQRWMSHAGCVPNQPTLHFNDINALMQKAQSSLKAMG